MTNKPGENPSNKIWPVGTEIVFLDAWGRNPVKAKVKKHYDNGRDIICEDERGVVYMGQTWRIASEPPKAAPSFADMFEDLLG